MNELEKPFRKKPIQKIEKYSKNQKEIAAYEQKTTSEKATLLEYMSEKMSCRRTTRFSCFSVTKITSPIRLQKS